MASFYLQFTPSASCLWLKVWCDVLLIPPTAVLSLPLRSLPLEPSEKPSHNSLLFMSFYQQQKVTNKQKSLCKKRQPYRSSPPPAHIIEFSTLLSYYVGLHHNSALRCLGHVDRAEGGGHASENIGRNFHPIYTRYLFVLPATIH